MNILAIFFIFTFLCHDYHDHSRPVMTFYDLLALSICINKRACVMSRK